jgi:hypothetical protein
VLCEKNVHEFENASSLAERSKNIPHNSLNAMDVGIDYLWTGALCIVQNDKEGIQSNLANMVIVYDNAELTIESTATNVSVASQAIHRLLSGRRRFNIKSTVFS